jgi:hypothetical protein
MKMNTSFVFVACMYLCVVVMIVLEEIIVERVRILGLPLGRVGVSFLFDSFVGPTFHTIVAFSSCSAVVATSDECCSCCASIIVGLRCFLMMGDEKHHRNDNDTWKILQYIVIRYDSMVQ